MRMRELRTRLFLIIAGISITPVKASQVGPAPSRPIRVMLDQGPLSLDPRQALDANGQRLGALLFRALTRLDDRGAPARDLATEWGSDATQTRWWFELSLSDLPKGWSPEELLQCMESYRVGKPTSSFATLVPDWSSTRLIRSRLVFDFSKPQPSFPKDASLLRVFRSSTDASICSVEKDSNLIGTGRYRFAGDQIPVHPDSRSFTLIPASVGTGPALEFKILRDPMSRVLALQQDRADVALNSLGLSKWRWLRDREPSRFRLEEWPGATVTTLNFNLRDSVMSRPEIRRAIALALPTEEITSALLHGFGIPMKSFFEPAPLRTPAQRMADLDRARALILSTGFVLPIRIEFRTTPAREGLEVVRAIRDRLTEIGIDLEIKVVEPAVFLAGVRAGKFQMHLNRWVGVSDAGIYRQLLAPNAKRNTTGYSNPGLVPDLDRASGDPVAQQRVERQLALDLPFIPLYRWENALLTRSGIRLKPGSSLSKFGSFDILERLEWAPQDASSVQSH